MAFVHFRILLTILAAFGPFMAYVCRLNLSLIIEEMVVKDKSAPVPAPLAHQVRHEHAELARRLPKIFSEEQSLAELSSGAWWLRGARPGRPAGKFGKLQANATRARPTLGPAPARVQLLSVVFDVSPSGATAAAAAAGAGTASSSLQSAGELRGTSAGNSDGSSSSSSSNNNNNNNNNGPNDGDSEMTREPASGQEANGEASGERALEDAISGSLLHWTKDERNDLLGAFFLGYVLLQVPAGRAAELFGPKLLFLILGLGTGFASLLFPLACRAPLGGIWWAYAVRFAMGASQAGLFPAVYVLLCNWLPRSERSSWLAVPSAMGRIGTIAMNFAVPAIMLRAPWEWVFYLSGAATLAWALVFLALGSDRPSSSRWLSADELRYIEARLEERAGGSRFETPSDTKLQVGASRFSLDCGEPTAATAAAACEQRLFLVEERPAIDWLKMLRSRALLVLTLVMFTSEWSNMLLLVKLPGFLGPALRMDLDEVGLWSSVLVAIYCVQYPLAGVLAARLEAAELEHVSSLRVRKLFELAAHAMQATACLIIALFESKPLVLASLVLMMLGRSTVGGGQCLMPPELSSECPGTVMALANSLANVAGVVGPMVVTQLVDEPTQYESWRGLWLLSAAIFVLGGLVFCLLADNRPQNYHKKPKLVASKSTSRAQLVLPPYVPPPEMSGAGGGGDDDDDDEKGARNASPAHTGQRQRHQPRQQQAQEPEIVRMDAFARVSSEPKETR